MTSNRKAKKMSAKEAHRAVLERREQEERIRKILEAKSNQNE